MTFLIVDQLYIIQWHTRDGYFSPIMTDSETWTPRCSIEEADRILTTPGNLLEIETRIIDGRVLKVWKNLWPSLRHLFLHSTKEHADKTCIVYEKERYTFRDILDKAVKCAAIFKDLYGIKKGDRVVICSHNCPNYLVVFWACHLLGAVTAFVNISLPLEPLRHCVTLTKCALIVLDTERADGIESIGADLMLASGASGYLVLEDHEGKGYWEGMDIWSTVFAGYRAPKEIDDPQISPEDDATITFTSGTTGLPKGVLSSQRAFLTPLFDLISLAGRDCVRRGLLSQTPLILSAVTCALQGHKVVLTRTWNIHEVVELCQAENIIRLGGPPSIIRVLAESAISRTSIKHILCGGAPLAASHLRRFKQAFPRATFVQLYGLTEMNAAAAGFAGSDYDAKPDSCGWVFPVGEVMIMKDDVKAAPGVLGEIWLRGPNVMKGYYGDKAATDKVLTKDGWLMTGDLGRMDEDGCVYITDRIKDIVIRDGYSVDSVFVENTLYTEPGVLETAVVGVPDEHAGELPVALVTLRPAYNGLIDEEKLIATAKKLLPSYAIPVMIILHDRNFGEYLIA
ncbi:acetyl-CoA synthetase-like protein [Guyanagaster necrorhizus]|uniref:Acetyl-CoA synthetase-like protein n=1 Tax=Guyanagaster necrorhizus TaxID=856835 RepID=A0A9P7VH19_9AGAR|nr:acetyl-CoA synthetase-like protein [Guyanagaster necrorhizus MCA 3950]KAG7440410.1 acetyl-CoA synthetase-like protein [Guyanagaster necrorhizus MCA 3950]